MKRQCLLGICLSLLLLTAPITAIAIPIYYSASGTFSDSNGTVPISGDMLIDSQLLISYNPYQPFAQISNSGGDYYYLITQFSLKMGGLTFSSTSSGIQSRIYVEGTTASPWGLLWLDTGWWLLGTGDFHDLFGQFATFYSRNMTGYYGNFLACTHLAPVIELNGLIYSNPNFWIDLWLVARPGPAVPEPCTLLLLGSGLLGLAGYGRKKFFKK